MMPKLLRRHVLIFWVVYSMGGELRMVKRGLDLA
jgi:hypothetical protein